MTPRLPVGTRRHPLAILVALTLASLSVLIWLGARLFEHDRIIEQQRALDRLGLSADGIVANVRRSLRQAGETLAAWTHSPPADATGLGSGVTVVTRDGSIRVAPAGTLLFVPLARHGPTPAPELFAAPEAEEFRLGRPQVAAAQYERLTSAADPATRAGALLRLARVSRRRGATNAAAAAYERLAGIPQASLAGTPADLVARHALCEIRPADCGVKTLRDDLLRGAWPITRDQFAFYWSDVSRWSGGGPPPATAVSLSEAAEAAWTMAHDGSDGQRTLWVGDRAILAVWRSSGTARGIWVTDVAALAAAACEEAGVACRFEDPSGRMLAGVRTPVGPAVRRTAGETQLPWTLAVGDDTDVVGPGMSARRRFLALQLSLVGAFLLGGTLVVGRAIRKDAAVSRLQTDFVSAVSHEFRSPLTTIRQLSEMLAAGRVAGDGRREQYYGVLVDESRRLERLVENLLDFGRAEAGVLRHRPVPVDVLALTRAVVSDLAPRLAGDGRRVEISETADPCWTMADPESLAVAIRNLIDNALKYSPDRPAVWIDCQAEPDRVALRVRDAGIGVARAEQAAIFGRFVRGSAAMAAQVRGTGVGLAMVRHIVAAHGGDIGVVSEPGEGSTFTVRLPRVTSA